MDQVSVLSRPFHVATRSRQCGQQCKQLHYVLLLITNYYCGYCILNMKNTYLNY